MTILKIFILTIIASCNFSVWSQVRITGDIKDSKSFKPLANVNIGIREKNVGTVSLGNGSFSLHIPSANLNDTLTFSMIGYYKLEVPINRFNSENNLIIRLIEKTTELNEFVISDKKLVQKKFGIKRRGLIHFTDGIFKKDDNFEIGQLITLGNKIVQITSVNLHINSSRPDSASFRINFYRYDEDDNQPAERLEESIFQRHAIREGWLRFDLMKYNILLRGKVFASIEFIPEDKNEVKQIYYEVKIGGSSKSFFRRNRVGQWNTPPHHYCLYITALVDKGTPEEPDDLEAIPTITLKSDTQEEPFSIFIRLPRGYQDDVKKKYPVIYHLDGNVFFDPISSSLNQLSKKKKIPINPILVGIGYTNAYVMDSLRNRDYTFPKALPKDSFHISGGGEEFYQFIKTRLKPIIERTYRTDTTNRTIMGHSLGGYFVLYALLRDMNGNSLFNNYVAASPSISYFDNYIFKQFENLSYHTKTNKKLKLYLTTGEMEIDEDHNNQFNHFREILSTHDFIQLKAKVYESLEHMGTAVPSFEEGMEFVLTN